MPYLLALAIRAFPWYDYVLHRFRELRKMGGGCIGEPSRWNGAKQAELRDTLPNAIGP